MLEMLQSIDPPVFYAVVGVIVLAIASLVGLVLFASKEETFEDVVAKQRKAQEALLNSLQGGSGKSGKNNKKWNKLKNKKASKAKDQEDEVEQEVVTEQDSCVDDDEPTPETVAVEVPPPVIAVEEPVAPPAASKKKKKGKKNKQEAAPPAPAPVVVEEEIVVPDEPIQEQESAPEVVEEVIVEASADVVDAAPVEEPTPTPEPVEVEQLVKSEPVVEIPEPVVVEPPTKSKKKKNKSQSQSQAPQQKNVITTNTFEKISHDLENSQLSGEEVQQIMDLCVKKQSGLEQWQKPNQKSDPVEILKKRIAEFETQFAEERQNSQAISLKLKESRVELQQERNARQSIQNEATNRLSQQAKEGETMRKRMEEKHLSEMHSAQSQIARMKEENNLLTNASMMTQQLAEDKQSLVNDLTNFQQQNKQLRQELDNVLFNHQAEVQNLHKAKLDCENALSQRLHEMSEQLMKSEAQIRQMQQAIDQTKLELDSKQQAAAPAPVSNTEEIDSLNAKHQEEINAKIEEINQLTAKLTQSETLAQSLNETVEAKSLELETKTQELVTKSEELSIKSQELEATRATLTETADKLKQLESTLEAVPVVAEIPEMPSVPTVDTVETVEIIEEVVPVNEEVAKLLTTVEEKNQLILVLEQKVAALESHSAQSSGQHSPDMVVVTPSDLLGSEPMLTSESFEEVSADKDCDSTQEIAVEVAASDAVESTSEESLLVEAPQPAKTIEALEKEIVELKEVEKSLREQIARMEADQSNIDDELKIVQMSLAEKLYLIARKDDIISDKETELAEQMDKNLKAEESLQEAERQLAESNATVVAKDDIIAELKTGGDTAALADKLKEVEEKLKAKTESAEHLTAKNNELREKNWKVVDALGQAEKSATDKIKAIEISICKGLKNLFPDVSIPKVENDFDKLFAEFSTNVSASDSGKVSADEAEKTKEINEKLNEEIAELKKTNELMQASQEEIQKSQEEIQKSQEENIHLKNVLSETESMLSRLQDGVDAEVQKWQKKVSEKETELEENKKSHDELKELLSKHGYEHENLVTLEANLSSGQKQLLAEKEENSRIKKEMEELEKKLGEQSEAAKPNNDTELAELNTKLKKTISERDLLIREYKSVKDSSTKMEAELKETKESLATQLQTIEQLKAGSAGTNDKDAEIAKLTKEITDLKEELREERDCVIVDIDPDNAENLHKQVENLSTELESEKQCKASLASKLHDIENSYQEEDKITDLESKLKSAEQKIKELEEEKSSKTRQDGGEVTTGGTSV